MILAGKSRGRRAYRPGLARAEFQKVHGRERCADEKEFGITEVESHLSRLGIIWKRGRGIGSRKTTSNFCGEDPDLVGRNSREITIARDARLERNLEWRKVISSRRTRALV